MQSQVLESAAVDGRFLRVEFHWHIDRYRHVVSVVDPTGTATPLLESIEGSPTEEWPPSPPLQSLHCEAQAGGSPVALLVGMAGRNHWSASIGPRRNENRLVFDLACRASHFTGRLGAHYRLVRDVRVESAATNLIRLQASGCTLELTASQERPTQCEFEILSDASLRIQPASDSTMPTQRWLYEVALQTSGTNSTSAPEP